MTQVADIYTKYWQQSACMTYYGPCQSYACRALIQYIKIIKISSYQYSKSHCGDETILRPSYLHNGISYTGKMTSLYWISPLMSCQAAIAYRYLYLHSKQPLDQVIVAQWCHIIDMVTEIWVNIGSGNGLMSDGTKPLPFLFEPMLIYNPSCNVYCPI